MSQGFPLSAVMDHLEAAAVKRIGAPAPSTTPPGQRPVFADDVVTFITSDNAALDDAPFGKPVAPVAPGAPGASGRRAGVRPPAAQDGVVHVRVPKEFAK